MEEYIDHLKIAYANRWLTNRGELVQKLEADILSYLDIRDQSFLLMNNGTIPLQIAVKLLGGGGEIITTPFSYVATSSSILWEGCSPVYVDIDPNTFNIDADKIENAITEKTTCILATHVYGIPCDVLKIDAIAKKHDLKVIYDAAHAFGVRIHGKSIFEFGDLSTCSFHATKIFHTAEGGGVFCKDSDLFNKIFYSHNFGHNGPTDFYGLGINGKMSEVNAAMGLAVLPHMQVILDSRKQLIDIYNTSIENIKIKKPSVPFNIQWNYSYYPIVFDSESTLEAMISRMNERNIFPRRYFYPSLNRVFQRNATVMEIAENVSKCVVCLPLYHDLSLIQQNLVIDILNQI
ncbi:MAG: DegT/DnrJ/EryC1/StrS family aminotransferase [Bacteroidota bacterium]